jgi:hypothetical protein
MEILAPWRTLRRGWLPSVLQQLSRKRAAATKAANKAAAAKVKAAAKIAERKPQKAAKKQCRSATLARVEEGGVEEEEDIDASLVDFTPLACGTLALHVRRECAPTQRQRAAVEGKELEREGVVRQALDVGWLGDCQEVVVFYCDIGGVSEKELKEIEDTDDFAFSELDAVGVSALKEALKWTKGTS